MIRSWDFNGKDFGRCIDCLRLAAQSLFRISGHSEVFTAIIIIAPRFEVSGGSNPPWWEGVRLLPNTSYIDMRGHKGYGFSAWV